MIDKQANYATHLIEQHVVDTYAGKQLTVLRCDRYLVNAGVEKMNNI
jgi:hypothetical protein